MGYGTLAHREAIKKNGICEEHRRSFEPIRSMVGFSRDSNVVKNTTFTGAMGEEAVCEYLMKMGHEIVRRNFKTYFCEIDVVSVREGRIYFTEVKYRKNANYGGGLAAVDKRKMSRMKFAAECFLKYHAREFGKYDPLLAVADVAGNFEVREWIVVD